MQNPFLLAEQSKEAFVQKAGPQFGTVTEYSGGKAKIKIDGDDEAANTFYYCIKSCAPNVGDRVFFVRTGGTLLVIGVI